MAFSGLHEHHIQPYMQSNTHTLKFKTSLVEKQVTLFIIGISQNLKNEFISLKSNLTMIVRGINLVPYEKFSVKKIHLHI